MKKWNKLNRLINILEQFLGRSFFYPVFTLNFVFGLKFLSSSLWIPGKCCHKNLYRSFTVTRGKIKLRISSWKQYLCLNDEFILNIGTQLTLSNLLNTFFKPPDIQKFNHIWKENGVKESQVNSLEKTQLSLCS